MEKLEEFFKLKERGTSVKIEVLAGITTFMTMAYVLAVSYTHLDVYKRQSWGSAGRPCGAWRKWRGNRRSNDAWLYIY